MNNKTNQEPIVFPNLVEADQDRDNFGSTVLMHNAPEAVKHLNAKGKIVARSRGDVREYAKNFALRVQS